MHDANQGTPSLQSSGRASLLLLVANKEIGGYTSGNDSSYDDSSYERIHHSERYVHMASKVPRQTANEVPEGNLIDLDSPPSSPKLIKLDPAGPQVRPHTEDTAPKPKATTISMKPQAAYSTSSQSQRGRLGPASGGISSRRPSPRSNGAMSRGLSAKASFYAGLEPDCKRSCP